MEVQGTNARGNAIYREHVGGDRYRFDFGLCSSEKGWQQWDTAQDASYFGVWVHVGMRKVCSFAEGDVTVVTCQDAEHFNAEIASMEAFYGAPPPAMIVLDLEANTRTDVFVPRLSAAAKPDDADIGEKHE